MSSGQSSKAAPLPCTSSFTGSRARALAEQRRQRERDSPKVAHEELIRYLQDPVSTHDSDDILSWWKVSHSSISRSLSSLTQSILIMTEALLHIPNPRKDGPGFSRSSRVISPMRAAILKCQPH